MFSKEGKLNSAGTSVSDSPDVGIIPLSQNPESASSTISPTIQTTSPASETQQQSETPSTQPAPAATTIPISGIEIVLPLSQPQQAEAQQPLPQTATKNAHHMITRSKAGNIKPTTHLLLSEKDTNLHFTLPKTATQALKFPHWKQAMDS
ncbi:hypothetical protein PIB30_019468 [Stylosanthes scabra]|uniref:Uncharacterized protein n=1 Tax=Stylosanthes scabra TaxID=79078 RepID=A0ABU6T820_9FABA|nr:hypothetical protein [Stylosanthes scabra]